MKKNTFAAILLTAGILFLQTTTVRADAEYLAPSADSAFWQHWGDGQAELAAYELTFPRYGELRRGTAVTIFVTETFSNKKRVKSDPGKNPPADEFPVLKLNLIQDFPTGVYDYNLMTSVFVALTPANGRLAGTPAKITFSSQEWCGQVYQQLLLDANKLRATSHSYFDGEADQEWILDYPRDGFTEDALFFWARGLAAPLLRPGESAAGQMLDALEFSRLSHTPPAWRRVQFKRFQNSQQLKTPAGEFEVELAEADIAGHRRWSFFVEKDAPHRIVKWEASDGRKAVLLGAKRMPYWKMNGGKYVEALKDLGLGSATVNSQQSASEQ